MPPITKIVQSSFTTKMTIRGSIDFGASSQLQEDGGFRVEMVIGNLVPEVAHRLIAETQASLEKGLVADSATEPATSQPSMPAPAAPAKEAPKKTPLNTLLDEPIGVLRQLMPKPWPVSELNRLGIRHIGTLVQHTREQLLKKGQRRIAKKGIKYIVQSLRARDPRLRLGMKTGDWKAPT